MPKKLPYWPTKLLAESKIHGGKSYQVRRIFSNAPKDYSVFVDAFGGMGTMTYNAPPGLESQWFIEQNYFRHACKVAIRDYPAELTEALRRMSYTRATYDTSCRTQDINEIALKAGCLKTKGKQAIVDVARIYIAVSKMSRGGIRKCGFSYTPIESRRRGGRQADENSWLSMCDRIEALHRRLMPGSDHCGVRLIWGSAFTQLDTILAAPETNLPKVWAYFDPTYIKEVRSSDADEYGDDEMTFQQHEELVNKVADAKFKVTISHYPHKLYDSLGWRTEDISMPNHSGQGKKKQRRIERLYMNY